MSLDNDSGEAFGCFVGDGIEVCVSTQAAADAYDAGSDDVVWSETLTSLVEQEIDAHTYTNGPRAGQVDNCADLHRLLSDLRAAVTRLEIALPKGT